MDPCADLECDEAAVCRLRYEAPDGQLFEYLLCQAHTDRAHVWLADRPHLAVSALSELLAPPTDQCALF